MGFPHGRVGRNLPDDEAYAYCGVIVEGSGLGEPVRKVSHPVISPLSEHRRGLIMLCNSDFSERLGGWESVILAVLSVEGLRSGYRTIHDIVVQRGRSPLWILNHPRFHGSAWKVPALDIEPSTISRFSVESPRSGYRTIHDFMVQRGKSPLWKPSQSGRSEPTAELAQPALSSRRAYIPAALTPDQPCSHFVAAQYLSIHDIRLKC